MDEDRQLRPEDEEEELARDFRIEMSELMHTLEQTPIGVEEASGESAQNGTTPVLPQEKE